MSSKRGFRIPGMVHILLSFIPWMLYWIFCGMGKPIGITIALASALALSLLGLGRRDLSLMDPAAVIFFGLASLATFARGSRIFIEYSGSLGYLALFCLAAVSLLAKQPYTLQVSKRDYPETYWRDPFFLLINNIITGFWALIFLANALVFFFLRFPVSVILSNILVASGIAFSMLFPPIAPACFTLKKFKKTDWRVEVPLGDAGAGKDVYDVLIVGSGIGGLTCGALLAREGCRVAVFERNHLPGGYCSSFSRRGFIFNTGVADVSGLWENGPISLLLEDLGLSKEDFFIKNTSRCIFRGRNIDISSNSLDVPALLQRMYPVEADNIAGFFADAREAHKELYREDAVYGAPLPAELIARVFGARALLDYPKEHPGFHGWLGKTYRQVLDEHFKDEELKTFFSGLLGYLGTAAEETPAGSALVAVISYYLHGGYFPRGGALRFARALADYIETHNGRVLLGEEVEKIVVESARRAGKSTEAVRGVRARGRFYESPLVVANVNAKTALLDLVGEERLSPGFAGYLKGLRMSPSVFMVFLGVEMDLAGYPVLIHHLDGGYGIVIGSNADPGLAPPGKSSVVLLAAADYRDFPPRGTSEYRALKEERASALIEKAEEAIPGLTGHIVVREAATPRTLGFYTCMPEGAIYAFDQSKHTERPSFKTPIEGLYLAGASTFPGGGIEAVTIAGRICANDITGWKKRSG